MFFPDGEGNRPVLSRICYGNLGKMLLTGQGRTDFDHSQLGHHDDMPGWVPEQAYIQADPVSRM